VEAEIAQIQALDSKFSNRTMKIRGLIIAALVFFVLAGILYRSEHHKPAEDTAKADTPPTILKLDQAAIIRLEISKKDNQPIRLAKADSGNWQITEPKPLAADQSTVSSILSALSALDSQRLVEEKAGDLKPYGLDQPASQVAVTTKDNKTQKLLIGDDTPTGGAAFAKLAADPRVFTLASFSKTNLDKGLNDLRDKRLITVNSDKISRLELIRKGQVIEFGRNKEDWQILKPKPLRADSSQVDELVRKLIDARMDLSGTDDKEVASAFAKGNPVGTAKVTDQSGTQQLEIRKNKDTYYAKSTIVEGAYKVVSDLAAGLEKGLDDFRNKKLFDFSYNDPNKVELHSRSKASFLARKDADWWCNGKKMDASSVHELISKLRDLTATKFPESGFAGPEIEATVTSDDGKRTEKVLISKSGNGYMAKREHEPALYQLESSAVDSLQQAADGIKPATSAAK
jgi:hypothetical protein